LTPAAISQSGCAACRIDDVGEKDRGEDAVRILRA
jgi:hypothetical protein